MDGRLSPWARHNGVDVTSSTNEIVEQGQEKAYSPFIYLSTFRLLAKVQLRTRRPGAKGSGATTVTKNGAVLNKKKTYDWTYTLTIESLHLTDTRLGTPTSASRLLGLRSSSKVAAALRSASPSQLRGAGGMRSLQLSRSGVTLSRCGGEWLRFGEMNRLQMKEWRGSVALATQPPIGLSAMELSNWCLCQVRVLMSSKALRRVEMCRSAHLTLNH